jgi:soluble lytic murein transglycosylase-like protein
MRTWRKHLLSALLLAALTAGPARAGPQMYEPMSESIRAALSAAISDRPAPSGGSTSPDYVEWRDAMSQRLARWIDDARYRQDLLDTVHYEATRAGLDPQLILGVIEVESAFRKYAVSTAGARGYMQIMPFWIDVIGSPGDNLFHMRTNLRYGCTILRHYLDIEKGDLFRALGRYNGSLGRATYPNRVRTAWESNWSPVATTAESERVASGR